MTHSLELIWHLIKRDFHLRYTGSALGVLWSVLVPLFHLSVLVFTFRNMVPVGIEDYPAFVYSALLPWTWFSSSLSSAGYLFFSHRDLVRRPLFSPWMLVVMNTASYLLTFMLSLPLLQLLLILYGRPTYWNVGALLLLMAIQAMLTTGLGFIIACWNVFYRDIAQLVSLLLSFLFFLTPIFYRPVSGGWYRELLTRHPMAFLIAGYRAVLFDGKAPGMDMLITSAFFSIAVCWLGYFIYRRLLPDVIDAL